MSSNPKIIVLKTREIIYTLLLIFFAALLILCLFLMFAPKKNSGSSSGTTYSGASETADQKESTSGGTALETAAYIPGIYTTPIQLGESSIDVEVTVDQNRINSIRLVHLSETAAAAFPLVSDSLEHITSQILEKQTLEGITSPQENRYTAQLLLSAVAEALELARMDTFSY